MLPLDMPPQVPPVPAIEASDHQAITEVATAGELARRMGLEWSDVKAVAPWLFELAGYYGRRAVLVRPAGDAQWMRAAHFFGFMKVTQAAEKELQDEDFHGAFPLTHPRTATPHQRP